MAGRREEGSSKKTIRSEEDLDSNKLHWSAVKLGHWYEQGQKVGRDQITQGCVQCLDFFLSKMKSLQKVVRREDLTHSLW